MTITWPELVVLMGFGDQTEDRISGVIRLRDVQELADDLDADELDGTVSQHPTLGRVVVRDSELRIERRGSLVRMSRPDGTVTAIFGSDTTWLFGGGDRPPTAYDSRTSSFGWLGADFVGRLPPSRWEGNDFTQLTGPISATSFLGRAAWAFELAPPPHKPFPLQMVVDAATGIVLRQANRDFGSYSEWTSLEIGADLPDDLFVWDGPVRLASDERAERDEQHEADLAARRAWLEGHELVFDVPVRPEIVLHEFSDETGAMHLSFQTSAHGSLLRRPLGDPAGDDLRYPHMYRWRDAQWEWVLGASDPLTDEELDALKEQLARSV